MILPCLFMGEVFGQTPDRAVVVFLDSLTSLPVAGITVTVHPGEVKYMTDDAGRLRLDGIIEKLSSISTHAVGYRRCSLTAEQLRSDEIVYLSPSRTQLSEVTIVSDNRNPGRLISQTDIFFRGVSNSQEVLRTVPGLFIAQHQGGGKAEQIFLRGFDNDHGKDIALSMDDMPINLVSHAHGQGYADSHFIIPETIGEVEYKKGMFDADKGDLAVSGWVNYKSLDFVKNQVKIELGQFNTFRGMFVLNLLGKKARDKGEYFYMASEYRYSDAYFKNAQHFKRANGFIKYHGKIGNTNQISITASAFKSNWDASGQISIDDVREGRVDYFGSVDPDEGGNTSRYNLNLAMLTATGKTGVIKNQLYYSKYNFDLVSNFTFFLNDEMNGDEIRQQESRNLIGYNGYYKFHAEIGHMMLVSEFGAGSRLDFTGNTSLSHTAGRNTLLTRLKLGNISQVNIGTYFSETLKINEKLRLNLGLRYDRFLFNYKNKLAQDTSFQSTGKFSAASGAFSPKLSLYYNLSNNTQVFIFTGKGFSTNDARSIVARKTHTDTPSAYGTDAGIILKPSSKIILSGTLWYSYLQQEFVYGGDGGTIEFSGRTRRIGLDLSSRFQPQESVYLDVDLNYAQGKSLGEEKGLDYIPFAPRLSSTGGITYMNRTGLSGSLRCRYLAKRPANQDYSLTAEGYLINDLVLAYSKKRFEIGLTVNNLFNVRWKESQFVEQTRLKGQKPREGITFTPGTKFATLCHLTYNFK